MDMYEKIEELKGQLKDINDDLDTALFWYARNNEKRFELYNGRIEIYKDGFGESLVVTDTGNMLHYDEYSNLETVNTQAEMWEILEGWK